jgi:hypothetical protein
VVLFEVIAYLLLVRCGGGRPADGHLGAQHLFEAGVHFFFFDKLTPVGLCNAFPHGGPELHIFDDAQSSILY